MASSKVARRRQSSLPKEPPASVDISDSDGEKDSGLDDFEIIKTIGKSYLHVLWCRVIAFGVKYVVSLLLAAHSLMNVSTNCPWAWLTSMYCVNDIYTNS